MEDAVCSSCYRLFDLATGARIPNWDRARFVSPTPDHLCGTCKDPIIDSLARAVPVQHVAAVPT